MPSTYTLNNGIELIATGEQSGTWGDTTNTNLSLLDTALDGQVTVTLASAGTSGSPNTLAISDGAASDGRNRMVIFNDGGDLGATAYVQLTPNDAEKIIYIRNDLAASRSIILFQGTYNASNDYEVPAGTTAVIYFDGAGSGAVAANVFNNAHFDAMNVNGDATFKGASSDMVWDKSASALNFKDGTKATFGDSSDLAVYHDGSDSIIEDTAAGNLVLRTNGPQIFLGTDGSESMIVGNKNGEASLWYDNSKKIATSTTGADVTGNLLVTGNVESVVNIQGTTAGGSFVNFGDQNDANVGQVGYDHTGNYMRFKTNDAERMRINSGGVVMINGSQNPGLGSFVLGDTNASREDINILTASSGAGHINFGDAITGGGRYTGNINYDHTGNYMSFGANGSERLRINSAGDLGVGTTSISTRLHVYDASDSVVGGFQSGAANAIIGFDSATTSGSVLDANVGIGATGDDLRFRSGGGFRGTLDSSGRLGIGVTPSISSTVGPSIDVNGVIAVRQPLNSHQTSVGIMEFNSNDFGLRAYGATAGTGSMSFSTGGGGGSADTKRLVIQSNGNVGLGNTSPAALGWPNGTTGGLFLQAGGLFSAYNAGTNMSQNWYYNSGEKYIGNGFAQRYTQSAGDHVWETALNNTGGAGSGLAWSEKMRISNSGHVGIGTNAANNTSEGAGLQVRKYINRVQYYSPAGAYAGSFAYTDNTTPRTWISVDSNYNQGSAVSAGLFLSAWHGDANGSTIGWTFKNNRSDQSLVWSRVTSATSVGSSANESEFMRMTSAGALAIGTNTPRTDVKLAVYNDGANSFIHTNPNSFDGTYKSGIRFSASIISAPLYYQGEIAFKGDNNYSGDMIFSTAPGGTTNAVIERMRITSGGKVGFFTTDSNPPLTTATYTVTMGDRGATAGQKMDLYLIGDTAGSEDYYSRIIFRNSNQTGSSGAQLRAHRTVSNYGTDLVFYTQGSGSPGLGNEKMRITQGGTLMVNKSSGTAGFGIDVNNDFEIERDASVANGGYAYIPLKSGASVGLVLVEVYADNNSNANLSQLYLYNSRPTAFGGGNAVTLIASTHGSTGTANEPYANSGVITNNSNGTDPKLRITVGTNGSGATVTVTARLIQL